MTPEDKRELKAKLEEKNIDLDKAGEELKVPENILRLYLIEDHNPIPTRIVQGLQKMVE